MQLNLNSKLDYQAKHQTKLLETHVSFHAYDEKPKGFKKQP